MNARRFRRSFLAAMAAALVLPQLASAHFIWVTVEPSERPGEATIHGLFNEPPVPDGNFLKYVRDLSITVGGTAVPSTVGEESREARWAGKLPAMADAERSLGVMSKGGTSYRLFYTDRAQTEPVAPDAREAGDKLRVRLIEADGKAQLEVLFDGKPVAKARIHTYLESGDTAEQTADDQGRATVEGLAEGKTALWANWVDPTPGEQDGKPYSETRYYATLTYTPGATPTPEAAATAFASMPDPAVNSFGGAVLGKWLYVYSGHVGRTHHYSVDTTAKVFRRLNLEDRTTWEDLPMSEDLQGVALVTDGRALYRIGGMAARNQVEEEHDLHSSTTFARFDPESKTWTDLPALPEGRSTHDAAVIGRTIYVAGGWTMDGTSEESEYPATTLAFDLDRPEAGWKVIPQPFRRRALSVAEHGGKLYVLGGLVGDSMKVERRVDILDPKTGTWSQGPDLPGTGRNDGFGTSAFGIEGRLYFSGASGRIFRLDDSGKTWEAVGAWSLPRITHRLLPGPDHTILAVGGNARGRQTPVIEAVRLPQPATTTTVTAGE